MWTTPNSRIRWCGSTRIRLSRTFRASMARPCSPRTAGSPRERSPRTCRSRVWGPWKDTSFHLRGDLELAGGEASFGVAVRNGLARPWATGTAPVADLADNSALFGTASWNGVLLGVTPSAQTVAGEARLTVELRTLDAELEFIDLERWGVKVAPGRTGTGTRWGDGDLEYSVEVRGNAFHRTGGGRWRGGRRVLRRGARGDGRRARTQRSVRGLRRGAIASRCGWEAGGRRGSHREVRADPP